MFSSHKAQVDVPFQVFPVCVSSLLRALDKMLGTHIIFGGLLLVTFNSVCALKTLGRCGRYCGRAMEPPSDEEILPDWNETTKIIGGYGGPSPRPWAVLLLQRGLADVCGGFLINRRFVLTVQQML